MFSWSKLPNEIQLKILCETDISSMIHFAETSHANYSLFHTESLWEIHYQRKFGLLDFNKDGRLQFKIAYLYHQANKSRPDHAQRQFKKIFSLLSPLKNKPWSLYYYGILNWTGKGIALDKVKGFTFFVDSYKQGDSRAVLEIARILIEEEIEEDGQFFSARVIKDFKKNKSTQLLADLKNLHEQRSPYAARLIAYFYQLGIGVSINKHCWKKWIQESAKFDLDTALNDQIAFCQGDQSLPVYFTTMEEYKNEFPDSIVVNWHLGNIYRYHKEQNAAHTELAITYLKKAAEKNFYAAKRELAFIYIDLIDSAENVEEKCQWGLLARKELNEAFENGDMEAGYALYKILMTEEDGIDYFKVQMMKGNPVAANLVDDFYENIDKNDIKAEDFFWLQLAVYFNGKNSTKLLKFFCEERNPYALWVMAELYKTGVPYSKINENLLKCFDYCERAKHENPHIAEDYQAVIDSIKKSKDQARVLTQSEPSASIKPRKTARLINSL